MRLGLPKGRLIETSERALEALGTRRASSAAYRLETGDVAIWLLKMRDIPSLVAAGDLDLGIAPDEWIEECGGDCERLAGLDGYFTRVSVLAPSNRAPRLDTDEPLRVATEFPRLTRTHLGRRAPNLRIVEVHGSCEAYPPELADVVVDCVETGETAREHGLEELTTLLSSRLQLIASPALAVEDRPQELIDRIVSATCSAATAAVPR